jgi:ribonucleoside-diphosphate reductase alpha chain
LTLTLSPNALTVLKARYLSPGESPEDRLTTVASHVAGAEGPTARTEWAERFYGVMERLDFLPNTPCLANAGKRLGQLDACFVLPIADSLTTTNGEGILDIARATGLIHQTGGGTGFDFSGLRPSGDRVNTTNGVSSGPVAFIQLINDVTNAIKQGGIRRGANMAEMNIGHPDIRQFILAKTTEHALTNFNISVSVSDAFMRAMKDHQAWPLTFRGEARGHEDPEELWEYIAYNAWKYGDPGVVFIDQMNRDNPLRGLRLHDEILGEIDGTVRATNPCGEVPLLSWEACTLGSINLGNFFREPMFGTNVVPVDLPRLAETVEIAIRFLDDVVEVNKTPLPQIDRMTRLTRRIGLGVMGWADLLNKAHIAYDSQDAVDLATTLAGFIRAAADEESRKLADERGTYPLFQGGTPMRNIARLSIAPTGSISTIADCSAGIEPYFARKVVRKVAIGELHETYANAEAPWFRTSDEIAPEWHVRHQAAWQRSVDNAVSKTINLPHSATASDVKAIYQYAYDSGCKGITIYRDGSREAQVYNRVEPTHEHPTVHQEGCESCPTCGWSVCTT